MFPVAVGVPAIALSLLGLFVDWRTLVRGHGGPLDIKHDVLGAALFIATLLALLGATVVIGQRLALPLFVATSSSGASFRGGSPCSTRERAG